MHPLERLLMGSVRLFNHTRGDGDDGTGSVLLPLSIFINLFPCTHPPLVALLGVPPRDALAEDRPAAGAHRLHLFVLFVCVCVCVCVCVYVCVCVGVC